MKKLILSAVICGFASFANAQSVDATMKVGKEVEQTETVNIKAEPSADVVAKRPRDCVTETGSRIKMKEKEKRLCNGVAGRSYDKEDLDRTGALTIGEALERLDPSVQIRR